MTTQAQAPTKKMRERAREVYMSVRIKTEVAMTPTMRQALARIRRRQPVDWKLLGTMAHGKTLTALCIHGLIVAQHNTPDGYETWSLTKDGNSAIDGNNIR